MPENKPDDFLADQWKTDYIDLLANPLDQRSDKEFLAEHTDVTESTFYRWKRRDYDAIFDEAHKRRQRFMKAARIANYKAIAANLKRSFNDRKLFAQIGGDLIERTESKIEYLTPDQKREKVNQLLQKLGKH